MDSFDRQWERWFPPEGKKGPSTPSAKHGGTSNTTRVFIILAGALALFILISVLKGFYTEWLWFNSLSYGSVYTTVLKTKILVFFSAAIIFAIVFLGNLVDILNP